MAAFDLAAAAAELYAADREDFVAVRTRLAGAARTSGDRAAATALGSCAKPVAAAWIVNRLVRDRPDAVHELLALGERLRAAQDALDGPALKRAAADRRSAVSALLAAAGDPGGQAGERVADTFTAATADADAAAAVASGRLLRPLAAEGLDPVDLTDAVALPDLPPLLAARPNARATRPARDPAAEAARREAEAARREAERARRDADAAATAAEEAAALRDRRGREVDDARARLDRARDEVQRARDALRDAERARDDAEDAAEQAAGARDDAERAARTAERAVH